MTKARVSNRETRDYVKNLKEFKANNLWSEWVRDEDTDTNDRHWPLFIYEVKTDMWFENASKYSMTTAKHKTQSHPYTDTTKLHVDDMIKVRNNGVVGMITGAGATA
jgi:hypothetical protein